MVLFLHRFNWSHSVSYLL